jgi:predicted permease
VDWRAQADAFSNMAMFGAYAATLTGSGEPEQVWGGRVSVSYFPTLGIQPLLGRVFEPGDESENNSVAVIGYAFWQSRFGGSDGALGAVLNLDGNPCTVIGVVPPGIYPTWPVNGPRMHFSQEYQDVWLLYPPQNLTYRGSHISGVVARLKPGVTIGQAQEQIDVIAARLERTYPQTNDDEGARLRPLMDEVAGSARTALLILLCAVSAVLLMACSNVASLLLARMTWRRREIAVRRALGAHRAALVRQFLVEGILLATLAGAAGAWLSFQGQGWLLSLVPQNIPRIAEAGFNAHVLAFTVGISMFAALLFGLVPRGRLAPQTFRLF